MHEYSIVQALYDKVAAQAAARQATRVHEVRVRIGELSGVDVGLLDTAWRTFRVHTICETAPMYVDRVPGDDLILERIVMEVGDV
jgi:hydrogenase nickel incorporation protein HypA/HybF